MTTRNRLLHTALRALVFAFGTAALWLGRDGMNPDGVAYLDVSDVFLAGGWPASQTGYWSPLYPTLLAAARFVGGTLPQREQAVVLAVNFIAFLFTFVALEFFVWSMRRATPGPSHVETDVRREAIHADGDEPNDATWLVLVYALFAVVTVGWIRLWLTTPDMMVAAIVLASAGICMRFAGGRAGWPSAVALGILLGLGYLAKAALLPVGMVVVATLVVASWRRHRGDVTKVAAVAAVFIAVSAPQVVYTSRLKGGPTFGDVGRLSYLWFIARVPGPLSPDFALPARLPSPDARGQTLAPLQEARDPGPTVYAIDAPIPGTLPIWYDAGHWYRGVDAPFYPLRIARALVRNARVYLEVLGFLIVGGLGAAVAGRVTHRDLAAMQPIWVLVIPAIAAGVMYALVLVQTRYIAPFVLLLCGGLVPPWASDEVSRRVRAGFAVGAVALLPLMLHQVVVDTRAWQGSARFRSEFAAALAARDIAQRTKIGFIGDAYTAYWARQARVRFVTLLPRSEAPRFWQLGAQVRAAVLNDMVRAGAQAVVAEAPAPGVNTDGWDPLPFAGFPAPDLLLYRPAAGVAQR